MLNAWRNENSGDNNTTVTKVHFTGIPTKWLQNNNDIVQLEQSSKYTLGMQVSIISQIDQLLQIIN